MQIGREIIEDGDMSTAVVLHEDKKYYPGADEVYGPGTETLVMEEDAQPLEQPIIAPLKQRRHEVIEREALPANYPAEFLVGLMDNPGLIRNVAVVGHLHHGKTSLMDMLVEQTHVVRHETRNNERTMRFTDTRVDEQVRRIPIRPVPGPRRPVSPPLLCLSRPSVTPSPALPERLFRPGVGRGSFFSSSGRSPLFPRSGR